MKQLSAAFVPIYVTILLIGAFLSVNSLLQDGFGWGWFGSLMAGITVAGYFLALYIILPPRNSRNQGLITGVLTVCFLLTIVGAFVDAAGFQLLPVLFALVGVTLWPIYVFWYSVYGERQNELLVVGGKLPELLFEDEVGAQVSSQTFSGHPLLLLFYRGNWCPFCVAQIKELVAEYQELASRGVQVVLVSPQPAGETRKLAERFEVPFKFLVDPGNRVARQLNIADEVGVPTGLQLLGYETETVMPTVVATDADGTILLADLTDNYRIRPVPATFLNLFTMPA